MHGSPRAGRRRSTWSSDRKDLRSGKLADPAYFSGEPLTLSRGKLAELKRNGALHSIQRP